jgi:DMSO reductase family type II enzyme heme b subunit
MSTPMSESQRDSTEPGKTATATDDSGASVVATVESLSPEEQKRRSASLFALHCAGCHGEKGDGVSVAARYLSPKPRNFRAGRFRLVSTENAVPTIDDLVGVLVRGMPGSSMPPWPQLGELDRRLLAEQVIEFRREGIRDKERALAMANGDEVDVEELEQVVKLQTTPGELVAVPDLGQATPEVLARGRQLFLTVGCAACHGTEGRGDGQQKMIDEEGLPTRPRDLTKGIFKGKSQPESIYRLFLVGMPGTPMPALRKHTPQELSDLTHFVLSLSDEQTRAGTVLNREQIRVLRVATIPAAPDSSDWTDLKPARLRTMPLWWRDQYADTLEVRAVHDGLTIAVHLSWPDAVADQTTGKTEAFRDAAAVELFRGEAEPFLGMGAAASPVDVWLWSAGRNVPQNVEDVNPNVVVDLYPFAEQVVDTAEYRRTGTRTEKQTPLSFPALATGNQNFASNPARFGSVLETAGPGTVTFQPPLNQTIDTDGVWKAGRWNVVLKRRLTASEPSQGLTLAAGQRTSVAFALWDGSHRDRAAQKVITIWQDLVME